ncbi:16S rRNA (uracil(1498)-N(3))-methyltransferase [Alteromonas facilis]|uniref:16S rRNA (uracil(1498)-N(3))-methyltransferase n=1 Tax=Alteromonas facilis TaxID=2048004 RepID=UPI000C28481D|nr:16S rRNA (uracil(1498)-N(3))-methyltransferase [Alteromonas facilis]
MRISRFFVDDTLAAETTITLPAETSHYMANVLRLSTDTPVVLFNGDGHEYSGVISVINKRNTQVSIDAKLALDPQSPLRLHLGQGVSKGERMDMALQKATELGVTEITPIITERCAVKLNEERWQKKLAQWRKIIQSACEQCGRNTLPTLHTPVQFQDWLKATTEQTRLLFDPTATQRIGQMDYNTQGYRLLVGPEGGLSEQETYTAIQAGYKALSMGPRILRTETAAIASIAVLQANFGDL